MYCSPCFNYLYLYVFPLTENELLIKDYSDSLRVLLKGCMGVYDHDRFIELAVEVSFGGRC